MTFADSLAKRICRSSQIQNTHFLWHAGKVLCGWLVVRQPKTAGPSLETTTWTIRVTPDQLVCSSSIYGTLNSQRTRTRFRNPEKVNNVYSDVFYWLLSLATWLEERMVSNIQTRREWEKERKQKEIKKEGSWQRVAGGGWWMKQAAENPAMTAATREQHAKPWKSFPASSKTFMEF